MHLDLETSIILSKMTEDERSASPAGKDDDYGGTTSVSSRGDDAARYTTPFQWPPARRALEGSAPLAHREAQTSISGHHKGDVTTALHAVFVWCRHVILLPGGILRHVLGRATMVNLDLMLALIDAPV